MFQKHRRLWIAAIAAALCLAGCITAWLIYVNTDRSGWEHTGGRSYYRDSEGNRVYGWQEIDGQTYYFGLNRAMHTGWLETEEGLRFFFDPDGTPHTGWLSTEEGRYYFNEQGNPQTGSLEQDGKIYLFDDNGIVREGWFEKDGQRVYLLTIGLPKTGWLEDGGKTYFLTENGTPLTGWLQEGEYRYYFLEDGTMTTAPTEIDGRTYYFTPKGIEVLLINRDHPVPDDYDPELVRFPGGRLVSRHCADALQRMVNACAAAGYDYNMNSIYRDLEEQWWILNTRTQEYMDLGYSYSAARAETLLTVAYPGTSEHHLGLAADILGADAQAWLQEHCWEYGFILRYLENKTQITGFSYEPWHFRYVGTKVSMDMKDTGLCLEEYLGVCTPGQEPDAGEPAA